VSYMVPWVGKLWTPFRRRRMHAIFDRNVARQFCGKVFLRKLPSEPTPFRFLALSQQLSLRQWQKRRRRA
jgi:hypothetical protein